MNKLLVVVPYGFAITTLQEVYSVCKLVLYLVSVVTKLGVGI
jgi:hypothetical protein